MESQSRKAGKSAGTFKVSPPYITGVHIIEKNAPG